MSTFKSRLRVPADFGMAIRHARLQRGLSQEELAEILNMPQSTISQIENGKSTIFLRNLLEIARETGIDISATWKSGDETRG